MRGKNPLFLKTYFLFAMIIIAIASFLYVQDIIFKLEENAKSQTRIFARFSSNLTEESNTDDIIFEEVISKISFPIIVTDIDLKPVAWRNIGRLDDCFSTDLKEADLIEMDKIINRLDRENKPIEIRYQNKILGIVHYGEDSLYKRIQFAPFFQLIVSVIFLVLGIYGYVMYRKSHENFIWGGMAKETAHQIGTPLSSVFGWIELLKNEKVDQRIIKGLEEDAERLNVISKRFNKIGSPLTIELVNIDEIINEVIDYFRKRVPSISKKKIIFEYNSCDKCYVPVDKELLKWSLENLIKNSIDALKNTKDGKIKVNAERKNVYVEIHISDNGKGIEKKHIDRIFNAGFSTKNRGWGIGLPLTKKIIEEFHKGKLKLDYTEQYKGTCFILTLPLGENNEIKNPMD